MKILLDTNFLVYCAKQKIDYVEEIGNLLNGRYELVVPFQVIDELKKLKEKAKKGKDKDSANLAVQIIEAKNIKKIKVLGKTADEAILNLAKKDKNIAATLDREMRHVLGRVILLRGKKLELTK